MVLTVRPDETNYFPVLLNMLEPDAAEFKTRINWINDLIKAGFRISYRTVFTYEGVIYLLVTLAKD